MMAKRRSHAKEPSPPPGACLLVALASGPKLAFARECPAASFRMGGRDYRDQGYGDWTGFYDWLRSAPDSVIGVRYWPFENTRFLADVVCSLPYVKVPEDGSCLEIYFSRGRVQARASDDQSFGSNRIFCSEEGGWAISFDTTGLSATEVLSLARTDAEWQTVETPRSVPGSSAPVLPRKLAKSSGAVK